MKYQDIHLADKSLWQQYQQYMQTGQTTQALALLENAQLADKGMTADVFNGLATEMVRLENQGKDSTWSKSVIPMAKIAPVGMQSGDMYFKLLVEQEPLFFTSDDGTISLALLSASNPLTKGQSFAISYNGVDWIPYTLGDVITLSNSSNPRVYFKGDNETVSEQGPAGVQFKITGNVYAGGSIMSLLRNQDSVPDNCFRLLFSGCSSLMTPPDLPASTVGAWGYYNMFSACTSLDVSRLELPATTLGQYAYHYMFSNCAFEKAPDLPATNISQGSYHSMFAGCTNLLQTAEMAATDLPSSGCNGMYYGCSKLQSATIRATTFGTSACSSMFKSCYNLSKIRLNYTGNFTSDIFSNWVQGVKSSGTFYYNGSDTTRGASAIPTGWTIQKF